MKSVLSIFLALSILLASNFVAPKADAVVGLIIKNRVTKIIGGVGMGAGGVVFGGAMIAAATSSATGWSAVGESIAIAAVAGYGILFAAIGLIILDEDKVVDFEFVPVESGSRAAMIYNSELEELNAVRKTMFIELGNEGTMEEANALWNSYKKSLSDETVQIAEAQAASFMQAK